MKVYYDDKCKVCKREIKFYKKFGVKNIDWIGIHKNSKSLTKKNKEKYLKKFHIIDDNNKMKVGVDAFIALWKKHKYFKYLAFIVNIFFIKILMSIIYDKFAKYRYKRKYNTSE